MNNQIFYIVDPAQLEFSSIGVTLQERRDRLRDLIVANGAQWAMIRMRNGDFMDVLEKLNRYMGVNDEFVHSAFGNSPLQLLPIGSYDEYGPPLGYYEPDRVREFDQKLRSIPTRRSTVGEMKATGILPAVTYAFRKTFAEAARRGQAVALEHG
jgi:hypothetical protein